ncbi:hypothetical protein UT300012_32750 [Paraclostridium bifermentans]
MGELYYLVGLPGSGKSTYAKELENKINAVRLSSDDLRVELYGNINNQDNNTELFQEMNRRTKLALKSGRNVIYDATNINSKKRKGFLSQLPNDINKTCIYFAERKDACVARDLQRGRSVTKEVIERMYKQLQVPMYHEGWDNIEIVTCVQYQRDIWLFDKIESYEDYIRLIKYAFEVDNVEMAQDTPYHTLSVGRHMYYAYNYVVNCNIQHSRNLEIAALLHDIGKPYCKVFNGKYASFYGHENISAQDAILFLKRYGFEDSDIIHIATLIQLHMRLHDKEWGSKKKERFAYELGENLYNELVILNNADSSAR